MAGPREPLARMSLDGLADWMAQTQPGAVSHGAAEAEFTRRQTILQQEATQAAKEAAEYTKRNAKYMLYSVIMLAASSVAQLIVPLVK